MIPWKLQVCQRWSLCIELPKIWRNVNIDEQWLQKSVRVNGHSSKVFDYKRVTSCLQRIGHHIRNITVQSSKDFVRLYQFFVLFAWLIDEQQVILIKCDFIFLRKFPIMLCHVYDCDDRWFCLWFLMSFLMDFSYYWNKCSQYELLNSEIGSFQAHIRGSSLNAHFNIRSFSFKFPCGQSVENHPNGLKLFGIGGTHSHDWKNWISWF